MLPVLSHHDEVLIDPRAVPAAGDLVLAQHPFKRDTRMIKWLKDWDDQGRAVLEGVNATESTDSRHFGAVPRDHLLGASRRAFRTAMNESLMTCAQVLERYTDGPKEGLFADGSARPNPGPGGWGVVAVYNDEVVTQRYGADPDTTNNRMELRALIEAYALLENDSTAVIYTDSQLCVNTITQWAAGWKARGWRKKSGPIKNLELVKTLYAAAQAHPHVTLKWIKAHQGNRWNEYADALATAWARSEL